VVFLLLLVVLLLFLPIDIQKLPNDAAMTEVVGSFADEEPTVGSG
jgi:hypothetical protein